jgi:hypothetical protein
MVARVLVVELLSAPTPSLSSRVGGAVAAYRLTDNQLDAWGWHAAETRIIGDQRLILALPHESSPAKPSSN